MRTVKPFISNQELKPLISIIIVNYNGKKWLDKCINSLEQQTYTHLEIIIVDNGSTDDSVLYIKKNFPSVNLVQSRQNLGFAGGNNLGIAKAQGELIMLINNDTWIENEMIQRLYEEKIQKKLDVIGPNELLYDKSLRPLNLSMTSLDSFGHYIHTDQISKFFYLSGVCLLFSKQLYSDTGGLDNSFFMYSEEIDWFWRLHLYKKKIGISQDQKIYHAGAGSTGAGIKYLTFLWRNQNTLQMLLKNYEWHNLAWVLPIYLIINTAEMTLFLLIGKPKISLSYIQGIWFNIRYFDRTMHSRKIIQSARLIPDTKIFELMYFGFAKFNHLIHFFKFS
ncbi:MAG: glycosyltransferase family 2 protein [Candidatus Parcubacteria bacterium]|nr:glycosyltransferase family 2 protein [Candidatus Paceibacterota bacterium]